jgi:hypothetical protein
MPTSLTSHPIALNPAYIWQGALGAEMNGQIGDLLCWAAVCEACQKFHNLQSLLTQCQLAFYSGRREKDCCDEFDQFGRLTSAVCNFSSVLEDNLQSFITDLSPSGPAYSVRSVLQFAELPSYLQRGPIPVTIGWLNSAGKTDGLLHYVLLWAVAPPNHVAVFDPWTPDRSARLVQITYDELLNHYRPSWPWESPPAKPLRGATNRGKAIAMNVIAS